MFTKKTYADIKKSTLKIQDSKKDSTTRLKHLKSILDFVDYEGAKSLFETNYSHVYFILYDTFVQAEINLRHKDLPFQIAHKAHREELDGSLWLLRKILYFLPELLSRRWQCHSLSRIMVKLLHLGNSSWLRKEGVRYFILWYQVLADNSPNYVHEMFADLIPGLIVPQKCVLEPDREYDTFNVFNHPNMKVQIGTSVFHEMMPQPIQSSETVALFPTSSNEKLGPLDPKEGLDIFLHCIVQTTACIKWRDNCAQKYCKSFEFLLSRFKKVFLPAICLDFNNSSTIYEPQPLLPQMRMITTKDEEISSCVVVLINWVSRFVHKKTINANLEKINFQCAEYTRLISNPKCKEYVQDKIVRNSLYSTQSNINFIHEVYRQGFLLSFTTKSQIDAMRTSVAVYRDWMTSGNPPSFMLKPNEGHSNSTSCSSVESSLQGQKLKSNSMIGAIYQEANDDIQEGLQNVIQVFVKNSANVFLVNTSNINIVFSPSNKEFQSTPLNEQTDICKKVLNVYRTIVMNQRMDKRTWEQLLLVLLQVTSIVLNQNPIGSKQALGDHLGHAIFQTLIVTWIRAHTNVPLKVKLWERFLNVLTSLTSKDELINEWEKTMQTLTRVFCRYVYNLNIQDLPLDRMLDSKGKRRKIADVWHNDLKERCFSSSHALNERNMQNIEEQKKKEETPNTDSVKRIMVITSNLGRCLSEGNLILSRKIEIRAQSNKKKILVKQLSFDHSLSTPLHPMDIHITLEKLRCGTHDSMNLLKGGLLKRAISLNSFHLKSSCNHTRKRDGVDLHDSRSPSPSTLSGIEGGSLKDSPMQMNASVTDKATYEDNASVQSPDRRSIILGGSVSGWLPDTASIIWKRMLGSLGDINLISRPELHAQVLKQLVDMTNNLIKIMENQGVSEDNLSTPEPPSLVPPISISIPWCYGAQLLSPEYKKGKLFAIKILCMLAIHGSIKEKNNLSLFYDLLHKVLNDEDRQRISCLFMFLKGSRFLSHLIPGHTLLLLDIVHASTVLLTSNEVNRTSPRAEVIALLGSLLCYPSLAIPKPVLQPSMQQIEMMECPDVRDHILNTMLHCARRDPSSRGRCIAVAQLGQWICLELHRSNTLENKLNQSTPQYSYQTSEVHSMSFKSRIKDVFQVILQALQVNHRTIAVSAVGSLKICSDQGRKLSEIENLPKLIINALCKALEAQNIFNSQESDKLSLTSFMMCLGEFCVSFPVHFMLDPIDKEGDTLIIAVIRTLFEIISEERGNVIKLLISDSEFDENISIDDIRLGKLNKKVKSKKCGTTQRHKLSIRLCAKSVIMHLVSHLGLFPAVIGASRLSSLVDEQDDLYLQKLSNYHEKNRDSVNFNICQNHQSKSFQVFVLYSGLIASFVELSDLRQPADGFIAGLVKTEKQVRVLLRDLNGKSCWEAAILYSAGRKLRQSFCSLRNLFSRKCTQYGCNEIFYSLAPLDANVLTVPRHTMRHRSNNKLPIASELAWDLNQLSDLLQYIGSISPECLIHSYSQLNMPGMTPLGCQLEAQTISILLKQRTIEQDNAESLLYSANEIGHDSFPLSYQISKQSSESFDSSNMNKSECTFQSCRLLLSHLGIVGWERRRRTHLLQLSEKLKRELRNVDIQKCRDTHKVAVVYVAHGQEDRVSILKNKYGSSLYESFVSALGWEIDLETHNGFLGGLPRQGCGATAPYFATPFVEVIYHTATRMPSDTPEALLIKTRHLGNDEIHIVWSEHHREYRREILPTEFCDVLIVIYPLRNGLFRVTVNWKPDVPWFGPLATESIVNGSCLATLVRETAINGSRSKRSALSLYQQYYEERNRSLQNVSLLYKENSTFEDFVNRVYNPNTHTILEDSVISRCPEHLSTFFVDQHRSKGLALKTTDDCSPRVPKQIYTFKLPPKEAPFHQGNMPSGSLILRGE